MNFMINVLQELPVGAKVGVDPYLISLGNICYCSSLYDISSRGVVASVA